MILMFDFKLLKMIFIYLKVILELPNQIQRNI